VFGPWFHGGWDRSLGDSLGKVRFESNTAELYREKMQLPFFDYYLRDGQKLDSLHEATIFFSGENRWRSFSSWPTTVKNVELYFSENKSLSFDKPRKERISTKYVSDPDSPVPYDEHITQERTREYIVNDQRFAENRKDVITFQTDVLDKDLTVAGSIVADLHVAISTTDADFVVKVIDVFPSDFRYADRPGAGMAGYEMLVRGEVFRGRYRNSYEKPEAFVPGKPTQVKFDLPDVAHTFRKGHRLMVQVQSSWFPLVDMNPQQFVNIYTCSSKDFVKSTVSLFHNASFPSKIVLPVLK
jgi:putative CocE/NonD family hydrolase